MIIKGIGIGLPDEVWDNERVKRELIKIKRRYKGQGRKINPLDYQTNNEWIIERTGFKERRIVKKGVSTSDLGTKAGGNAMDTAKVTIEDIDAIICATVTPDYPASPDTACLIQKNLKAHLPKDKREKITCPAFDLSAACSTFPYALLVCYSLLKIKGFNRILLIGADVMSSLAQDRSTFILFADAGAALILEASEKHEWIFNLGADGDFADRIIVPAGGSRNPIDSPYQIIRNEHLLRMEGNRVFKEISGKFAPQAILNTLKEADLKLKDIDWFFFHQANLRMVDYITKKLGISERTFNNGDRFGNTTSASIPLELWEAHQKSLLKKSDKVMLIAFGGGYTWGIVILEWTL